MEVIEEGRILKVGVNQLEAMLGLGKNESVYKIDFDIKYNRIITITTRNNHDD